VATLKLSTSDVDLTLAMSIGRRSYSFCCMCITSCCSAFLKYVCPFIPGLHVSKANPYESIDVSIDSFSDFIVILNIFLMLLLSAGPPINILDPTILYAPIRQNKIWKYYKPRILCFVLLLTNYLCQDSLYS